MSWDSVIRFYRFVLRSGDEPLADLLTRALATEPTLRPRIDGELRAAGRAGVGIRGAPDWVLRTVSSRLGRGQ